MKSKWWNCMVIKIKSIISEFCSQSLSWAYCVTEVLFQQSSCYWFRISNITSVLIAQFGFPPNLSEKYFVKTKEIWIFPSSSVAAWLAGLWPNYVNDKRQIVGYFNWCENNHYISIYPAPTFWQPTARPAWSSLASPVSSDNVRWLEWNEETLPCSSVPVVPPSSLLPRYEHVEDERVARWFTVQTIHGWHQPSLTCKPAIRSEISSEAGWLPGPGLSSRLLQWGLAGDMWGLECHNISPVTAQVISLTDLAAKVNISKYKIVNWGSFNIWYHLLDWSEERLLRKAEARSAIDRDIICIYHPNIKQHKPSHHLLVLASQSAMLWNTICWLVWMLSSQVINTVIVMILLLTTLSPLSIRGKYSVSSNVIFCKVSTWRELDFKHKICNLLIRNIRRIVINWNLIWEMIIVSIQYIKSAISTICYRFFIESKSSKNPSKVNVRIERCRADCNFVVGNNLGWLIEI